MKGEAVWPCSKCGMVNSNGDKKCPYCGTSKRPWPKARP